MLQLIFQTGNFLLVFLFNRNDAPFKIKGFKPFFGGGQLVAQGEDFFGLLRRFFKRFQLFLLGFFNFAVQRTVDSFKLRGLLPQAGNNALFFFPLGICSPSGVAVGLVMVNSGMVGIAGFKSRRNRVKTALYSGLPISHSVLLGAGEIFYTGF